MFYKALIISVAAMAAGILAGWLLHLATTPDLSRSFEPYIPANATRSAPGG